MRAWLYLLRFSVARLLRFRQMSWVALGLLGVTVTLVGLNTAADRWGMQHWRWPRGFGPTYEQWDLALAGWPRVPPASGVAAAVSGAYGALLGRSGFLVFSNLVIFSIFLGFLLPIWSLSFATEAVGGEREAGTLTWLLATGIPRPAIYLARFLAVVPFTLGLNLGGLALLCTAAGSAGKPALGLFWPAILLASLAFTALFQLMGVVFRRPAVMAIVYSFFLETVLANMPGTMKRISIGFYTRCMMFETTRAWGLDPEKPSVYLPVDGRTAALVLVGVTATCLVLGMMVFARSEFHEWS